VVQWQHSHEEEEVMSNRLPRRLFVILGWVVIAVLATEYCVGAILLLYGAALSEGYIIGAAWYLTLLGGALITLVLSIVTGSRIYPSAPVFNAGCFFTFGIGLLSLFMLLLSFFSPLGWLSDKLFIHWNPFWYLFELLRRFIG
jgi:hypothetical protein